MSSNYFIDTFAWIEYFRASEKGKTAKEFIEKWAFNYAYDFSFGNQSEIKKRYWSEKWNPRRAIKAIRIYDGDKQDSELDFKIAIETSGISEDLNAQAKGWGLADSIVFALPEFWKEQ